MDIRRAGVIFYDMKTSFGEAPAPAPARLGPGVAEDQGWLDFREQCRRQMRRPLEARIQYGFCRMHKPVLDDAPWRVFDSMTEYRAWCSANLPAYLGFKTAAK
jgi:hypothetical protein